MISSGRLGLRFALASLVAFAITGVSLHLLIGARVAEQDRRFAAFHAVFAVNEVLVPLLRDGDFEPDLRPAHRPELSAAVHRQVLIGGVVALVIRDRADGRVLFDERLEESLSGDIPVFETSVPFSTGGSDLEAVVAQDVRPTAAEVARTQRNVDMALGGGLVVLYLLVLPLARAASRQLRRQAQELGRLLAHERDTVHQVREVERMRSELISNASHELRTPLTAVIGLATTMRRPEIGRDEALREEFLDRIVVQTNRLHSLIEQLLHSARLADGSFVPECRTFDVVNLVRNVSASCGGGRVVVDAPEVLPVESDPDLLAIALREVIDNALKFSPSDEPCRVTVTGQEPDVGLTVEDNGIGMTEDQLTRAHEAFWQADGSLTRERGGVGLGLSLAVRAIEAIGGRLSLDSQPGAGTTVSIHLPGRTSAVSGRKAAHANQNVST